MKVLSIPLIVSNTKLNITSAWIPPPPPTGPTDREKQGKQGKWLKKSPCREVREFENVI